MMMILGMFVFSLPTLAYHELQRQTEWKHPANSIVGGRDQRQYTGKGEDICWRAVKIDHPCATKIDQGRTGAEYTASVDKSMH